MRINLIPAPYNPPLGSKDEVVRTLMCNKDFIINDVSCKWDGASVCLQELLDDGYTHAQVRYGKNLSRVWFGPLPTPNQ